MHTAKGEVDVARTTISLPDDLKAAMDEAGDSVNWSAIAASAFRMELQRIATRRAKTEGKKMNAAIQRLRASRKNYIAEARDRGQLDGTEWAMSVADYGDLQRLSDCLETTETCETDDALGAPGVFLRMITVDQHVTRYDIDGFWEGLGKDNKDSDKYAADYWNGFVVGALEVFAKVD